MLSRQKAIRFNCWDAAFFKLTARCFVRKLASLFILVLFTSTITQSSMVMLSIEQNRVYTESYCLNHIIKTSFSSPSANSLDKQHGYGSYRYLSHRHIPLIQFTIPEQPTASSGTALTSTVHFLPPHPIFYSSPEINPSQNLLNISRRLKLPIAPLLQSSILLIWKIYFFM